jgi:NAD(P)-dependent dehydrogenase (short-subunit alcohol dehydrogenase family)
VNYFITGTRRGLGKALAEKYGNCESLEKCDVFINCKHDGFSQVEMLYKAAEKNKRIVNIGSNSADGIKDHFHTYAVEKAALDKANEQLFYQGVATSIIRFGYIDTERVAEVKKPKINLNDAVEIIDWVISCSYNIKELTVTP